MITRTVSHTKAASKFGIFCQEQNANTISGIANGCFFNLGARLARYTGNETYADWARKTWDWINEVGFMTPEGAIYDGAHVETNCTDFNKAQFSYNTAVWALGAAFMYNHVRNRS